MFSDQALEMRESYENVIKCHIAIRSDRSGTDRREEKIGRGSYDEIRDTKVCRSLSQLGPIASPLPITGDPFCQSASRHFTKIHGKRERSFRVQPRPAARMLVNLAGTRHFIPVPSIHSIPALHLRFRARYICQAKIPEYPDMKKIDAENRPALFSFSSHSPLIYPRQDETQCRDFSSGLS